MARRAALLAAAVLLCAAAALRPAGAQAFLQEQLPLKPLVTTPSELLTGNANAAVTLQGRQAITAVFSRPVIALGSDFGQKDLPQALVPFTLTCGTPGRLRWVTTNIARFDPSVDWPTDLACEFKWNQGLKSFDGVTLDLDGNAASVKLRTQQLVMSLGGVSSKAADEATGNLWSADVGLPDDNLPEVPPGANVTLSFSYPVDLAAFTAALKVLPGAGANKQAFATKATVLACPDTPAPTPLPLLADLAAGGAPPPAGASCAVVQLSPALPPTVGAVLRLPKGARYSPLAGPAGKDYDVAVFGLRRFRIPLRQDWADFKGTDDYIYDGAGFRRLDMWLPHGLAAGVDPQQLKPLISICRLSDPANTASPCAPLGYNLSRPAKGRLQMAVPGLEPRRRYRVAVQGSAAVKDAFGLPLQPTTTVFWSKDLDAGFEGPQINGKSVIFEVTPGAATLTWPFVSRGKAGELSAVSRWQLSEADVPRLVAGLNGYNGIQSDAFGAAESSLARAAGTSPNIQRLPLPAGAGMSLAGACCAKRSWPTESLILQGEALILQSDLQAAFVGAEGDVTAWVTGSQGAGGPVEGARVALYFTKDGSQTTAVAGPSCTTGKDGSCTVDAAAIGSARAAAGSDARMGEVSAFVTAAGRGPLLVTQVFTYQRWQSDQDESYKAVAVLDRPLVKPGDTLHVTAYIQRVRGAQLLPPSNLGNVIFQVTPNFEPSSDQPLLLVAKVDPNFGSAHLRIPVPSNSRPGDFNLGILAPSPGAAAPGPLPRPVPLAVRGLREWAPRASVGRALAAAEAAYSADADLATGQGAAPKKAAAKPPGVPKAAAAGAAGSAAPAPRAAAGPKGAAAPRAAAAAPAPRGAAAGPLSKVVMPPIGGAAASTDGQAQIGSATFTVADPRPPTAELTVDVAKWVRPNARVAVGLMAKSYVGTQVSNAPMTVTWTLPNARGDIQVTTNADGVANATIDLRDLPPANVTRPGDTLDVKATWIGPTREAIIVSKSVRIADGPVRVELSRTLETDLPGVPFGVAAAAFSNEDDSPMDGQDVVVTVAPANNTEGATGCTPAQLTALAAKRCAIKSGDTVAAAKACQLALPCVGTFAVKACVGESCSNVTLGRNATEWASYPWNAQPRLTVLADKAEYRYGQAASLVVQNPYWGPASALVVWGSRLQRKQKFFATVPAGVATLPLGALGPECRSGCDARVILSVTRPAGNKAARPVPAVPVSKLFDPLSPHTPTGTVHITVPQGVSLSCAVSVVTTGAGAGAKSADGVAVVAPNGTAAIEVKVTDENGNPLEGAEVTMVVVDKAILDLMPYPLQNVSSQMTVDNSASMDVTTLDERRATRAALNATFATLQRRLGIDPWLPLFTRIQPSAGYIPGWRTWGDYSPYLPSASPVDVPDSKYLADYVTQITKFPSVMWNNYGGPMMARGAVGGAFPVAMAAPLAMAAPAPAPAMANAMAKSPVMAKRAAAPANEAVASDSAQSGGGAGGAGGGGASLRLQSDFKVTPLFVVATTAAGGAAYIGLRAPPNLGRFEVRAYVASPANGEAPTTYGAGESEVIVRRGVSLLPSVPRIVRSGDSFEAGVIVTAPGEAAASQIAVTATITAAAGANAARPVVLAAGGASESKTVSVSAGGQEEVRFKFSAKQVGNGTLRFVASAAGGASDALELQVPVLGRQGDVYVATSFAVRPNATSGSAVMRQEGLALPKAENGTGSLDLLAGVGYLPAVQATFESIYSQVTNPYYKPNGPLAISVAVLPAMLALYRRAHEDPLDGEPPKGWLTDGQYRASLRGIDDALGPLDGKQFGLLWSDPREYTFWTLDRCDVTLNAWAYWMVTQLKPPQGDQALTRRWGDLAAAAPSWRTALSTQLVRDAVAARAAKPTPYQYSDLETLSWGRLVLGSKWAPDGQPAQIVSDLAFSRLTNAWRNLTVGAQARVGLVLAAEKGDSATLAAIVKGVQGSIRVGGRTAYVASAPGERAAASVQDNALALLLFIATGATPATNPLVQKVAAFVAEGPARNRYGPLCVSVTGFEGAVAARGLSTYDDAAGSARPDVSLNATAASNATKALLLSAKFDATNAGALKRSSTPWSKVPPNSRLVFASKGRGEVSVAASLNFVPAEVMAFPTYRGLWVQRVVQLRQGGSVVAAPLAAQVTIAIQVTSPDDMQDVVVEAMMPGGLEPLDPKVYPDPDLATICGQSQDELDLVAGSSDAVAAPRFFPRGGIVAAMAPVAAADPVVDIAGPLPPDAGVAVASLPDAPPAADAPDAAVSASAPLSVFGASTPGSPPAAVASPGRRRLLARPGFMIWPPWPVCPAQETLPAVVRFRFAFFSAGTHSIRFQAIAATPGNFTLPPVKAYVAKQPEVMGLSPGGRFTVCGARAAKCDTADRPAPAAPKNCPSDCNGNGACNLATGACICDAGFSGKACGTFAAT